MFYVFFRIRKGDASALYAGVEKLHEESTANLVAKVK
jgi:hypothetical protein